MLFQDLIHRFENVDFLSKSLPVDSNICGAGIGSDLGLISIATSIRPPRLGRFMSTNTSTNACEFLRGSLATATAQSVKRPHHIGRRSVSSSLHYDGSAPLVNQLLSVVFCSDFILIRIHFL